MPRGPRGCVGRTHTERARRADPKAPERSGRRAAARGDGGGLDAAGRRADRRASPARRGPPQGRERALRAPSPPPGKGAKGRRMVFDGVEGLPPRPDSSSYSSSGDRCGDTGQSRGHSADRNDSTSRSRHEIDQKKQTDDEADSPRPQEGDSKSVHPSTRNAICHGNSDLQEQKTPRQLIGALRYRMPQRR